MKFRDHALISALTVALIAFSVAALAPTLKTSGGAAEPTEPGSPGRAYVEGVLGRATNASPFGARTAADRALVALLFRGLVKLGPGSSIVGDLASSWDVDKAGRTWTFHLRPDQHWQDGEPITADDVAFTIDILSSPAYTGPGGESWRDETWVGRDGRTWSRSTWQNPAAASASPSAFPNTAPDGKVVEVRPPNPLRLGGAKVTIEQLQALPTDPAALKARIAELVSNSEIRTSAGTLTDAQREQAVFEGLVSLVSQLPAPPKVRAAALRAIATYPNVTSLGAVDGGQGLLIAFYPGAPPARLVIDPTSGQLRRTNVLVMTFGGTMTSDGGIFAVTAEWTDALPR